MRKIKYGLLLLVLIFSYGIGFGSDKKGIDGPYVMYNEAGQMRVIRVNEKGKLLDSLYTMIPPNYALDVYTDNGKCHFQVNLHPLKRPGWKMAQREKTVVVSDLHGNFDCFVSVLQNNGVIGKNYEWIFGKNHLIVIGDIFDRGKDVLPIYWLMYKLEQEAENAGGMMTFLLGNHEEMVLRNNLKYTRSKYKDVADELGMDYAELWGGRSELGRWLQTRNLIEIVGDNLFVHAGLGPEFCKMNYSIPAINEEVGRSIALDKEKRGALSVMSDSIYSTSNGPFWYRGMVKNEDRYRPVYTDDLTRILQQYGAKRIFVGHTIFDDVTSFFKKKVIAVNVDNQKNKEKGLGRGILMQGGELYVIYDKGEPKKYSY